MKKILITNDDGIDADGIVRLAEAAKQYGEVWVVAPDTQRSAVSHSVTLRHSFDAWEVDFPVEDVHAYACTGTPADCVRIGVLNIVPGKPDYVFSGINYGYNTASDMQYSATVGAAFEGSFQGVPSFAFSEDAEPLHEVTDHYIHEVIREIINKPLRHMQIWNVNFPCCPLDECQGILYDRKVSDDFFYEDHYDETKVSDTRTTYMIHGVRQHDAEAGSDIKAVLDNYVSVGVATNIS